MIEREEEKVRREREVWLMVIMDIHQGKYVWQVRSDLLCYYKVKM